jgi:hypothetical protein
MPPLVHVDVLDWSRTPPLHLCRWTLDEGSGLVTCSNPPLYELACEGGVCRPTPEGHVRLYRPTDGAAFMEALSYEYTSLVRAMPPIREDHDPPPDDPGPHL